MKKDILFVINNLNCGGAEKSLISLLNTIDYSRYNVDLFLFKHEGLFFNKIPTQVNILEEPSEYRLFDMSIKAATMQCLRQGKINIALSRVCAGYIFKSEKNSARCEQRVWRYLSQSLQTLHKTYDVAIGYLEKNPVYFCVDKVKANKKIGFIHTDYDKFGMDSNLDMQYFRSLDHIVTVSEECANVLKQRFPIYKDKIGVIHNIVSPSMIYKMSQEKAAIKHKGIKLVSVGRLSNEKGFDFAVKACKNLVQNGYEIKWYIIGEGEERNKLARMIEENHLQEHFFLLGMKENPYPYIKEADIYVQSSRFEGKSIAIDEAKILHKPIVVTNFSTAKDQIKHEENGIIVEMNGNAIAEGIQKLIHDEKLRNKLIQNLSNEELGTESEIEKLYTLLK
ncbi:glycosyltransferase [Bacillus sp. WLY-B-L8]|uniref:glycosyltransferase n=1 Tax=Bacillus multifaciens TaxID=3068506 RepID=UPI00274226B6|nr:glycosyltransferase [Bacillus sp. WLY-B-L8]MDP7979582.1 glycosyltransferase [Bacillus sp. WLY-B-L8]